MDRDPGDFPAGSPPKPYTGTSDDELAAWIERLPPGPDSEDFDTSIAGARADVAAGRTYPHEIVGKWLKTWGKPGRKPFQQWLAEQDG